MSRNNVFVLIIILVCFTLLELIAFIAGRYLIPDSLVFNPNFSEAEKAELIRRYDAYLKVRDPVLGWPLDEPTGWQPRFDSLGSRFLPATADPGLRAEDPTKYCASTYGDSFTWSAEVSAIESWPYVLSQFLGCPVGNFGVGGYGSDQAYLRYLNKEPDGSRIVFLNHLSENILRNVGQFRTLSYGYAFEFNMTMFKPRFVTDDEGQLKLIELPDIPRENYLDMLYYPEKYLPYEYFLPGGDSGLERFTFPYTWSLIRTLKHFHVRAELAGKPWFMDFYEPDHPSRGLQVTAEILKAFSQAASKRGQVPILTVIPTGNDLKYFAENGAWPYQNLLDMLSAEKIDVLNFGPGVMERLGSADPCSLFEDCSSHFNATGYRYLAEIAYEEIEKRNLLNLFTPAESAIAEASQ